jgi:hypothetical protein
MRRAPALATSTRLPPGSDIEEEGLLDRVLVRAGLDVDAVLRKISAARKISSRLSSA